MIKNLIIAYKTSFGVKVIKGSKLKFLYFRLLNYSKYLFPKSRKKIEQNIYRKKKHKFVIKNKVGKFLTFSNNDSIGKSSEFFEYRTQSWFKTKENNIFIDIGANIGFYSIFAINRLKYKKVYAFEPNPSIYNILNQNISLNKLKNKIFINNMALGSKKEKLFFSNNKVHSGRSMFIPEQEIKNVEKNPYLELLKIETQRFDEYIKKQKINVKNISLIKIDVEEFDLEVLNGMKTTLKNLNQGTKIFIEIHDKSKSKKFLEENGFKLEKKFCGNHLFVKNIK